MKISEMRDQLIRAKLHYGQNKTIECIGTTIMVLRALGDKSASSEVAGALREVMLLIGKDCVVTDILGREITFSAGQEKNILMCLSQVFKTLMDNKNKEDHATALARKLNIDKYLNEGMRYIKENKVSDADQSFSEAIKYYKDEHSLFLLIGEALMEAGAAKRAFPYLAKGVTSAPDEPKMQETYDRCVQLKDVKR